MKIASACERHWTINIHPCAHALPIFTMSIHDQVVYLKFGNSKGLIKISFFVYNKTSQYLPESALLGAKISVTVNKDLSHIELTRTLLIRIQ